MGPVAAGQVLEHVDGLDGGVAVEAVDGAHRDVRDVLEALRDVAAVLGQRVALARGLVEVERALAGQPFEERIRVQEAEQVVEVREEEDE